jgi:membrane-associated phospholipid phosphatase
LASAAGGFRPSSLSWKGLRSAGANVGRVGLLAGVILVLAPARQTDSLLLHAGGLAAALAALALGFGLSKDLRPIGGYVAGFMLFVQLRALADDTGLAVRMGYVIEAERFLFAGQLPTVWLQERLYEAGSSGPVDVAATVIYVSYFTLPHALALGLWLRSRDGLLLYASAAPGVYYVGLAASFLAPTAPPWLAGQLGEVPAIARIVPEVSGSVAPGAYARGEYVAGINDVAAMPSVHTAVTVVVALMAARLHPLAGLAGGLYALSMGFSLVYLGEHYFVDVLAGALTAGLVWTASVRVLKSLGRRRVSAGIRGPFFTEDRDYVPVGPSESREMGRTLLCGDRRKLRGRRGRPA